MEVQSNDTIREIQKASKIQTMQGLPKFYSDKITFTQEVNPHITKEINIAFSAITASGAGTILSGNNDLDVYITGVELTYAKDAACDKSTGSITITSTDINSKTVNLAYLAVTTLTAQSGSIFIPYHRGFKIKRGTSINFGSITFTAGECSRTALIHYYTTEKDS